MKAALAVKQNAWTWQDYRSWPDSERWQIVGGEAYAMSPAPATRHQLLAGRLNRQCAFTRTQAFRSPSFPDLELDLEALFDLPLTQEERLDVVRESRPPPYAAQPNPDPSPS